MGVFYDHIVFDYWPSLHRVLEANRPLRVAAKAGGYAGLFLLVVLTVASYQSLDESGWILHNHDTPVWIQGDWLVGEYRMCDMPVHVARLFCGNATAGGANLAAFPDHVSDDDAVAAFSAAMDRDAQTDWTPIEKYFHTLPVRYWGRLDRPERDRTREILSWRCQRRSDSLKCKALD